MATFLLSDMEFFYEVQGVGGPFVFSHGLGGRLERVRDFVQGLPGTRVILYDNRAHGRTRPLCEGSSLTFANMADDVAGLLDHLEISKAVVGGVSMGAGVALAFGLRHPKRARALVLSRPAWLDRPGPPNLEFTKVIADIVERVGKASAMAMFEQTAYYSEMQVASPATAESLRTLLRDAEEATLLATYRNIPMSAPVDSMARLQTLGLPALVIGNRNDPIHPFEYAEAWAHAIPGSRFREIICRFVDEEAHIQQFRAAVIDYLDDLPK